MWNFLYPPVLEGVPKNSMPSQAAALQAAPNQPWCGLWGLRVSDVPSPRGQPAAVDGGTRDGGRGFFSHLFGLVLLGAPWLFTGAVGHRNQKGEGFQPPFLVKGGRSDLNFN